MAFRPCGATMLACHPRRRICLPGCVGCAWHCLRWPRGRPTAGRPGSYAGARSPSSSTPEKHGLDERHVALWAAAPPGARQELVAEDPRRFFVPRFGGYDWVGMRLDLQPDGPDWQEVTEILTDAYRQVAPKFLVARLD